MKKLAASALIVCGLALAFPAHAADTAKAEMKNAEGQAVGAATFTQTPNGVLIAVELKGLPEGVHGLHVHQTGKCEPPFESAGDHFNPGDKKHGLMAEGGFHAGDMPNISIPASGELKIEVLNAQVSLGKEGNSLLDDDGSALLVHADPDDYKSDPSGHAGDRIACGVIE